MFGRKLADNRRKASLCRKQGIVLLKISYTVPHWEFENYIRNLLMRNGQGQHAKAALNRMENGKIDLSKLNA